jgi:hypothetical protein
MRVAAFQVADNSLVWRIAGMKFDARSLTRSQEELGLGT